MTKEVEEFYLIVTTHTKTGELDIYFPFIPGKEGPVLSSIEEAEKAIDKGIEEDDSELENVERIFILKAVAGYTFSSAKKFLKITKEEEVGGLGGMASGR